MPVKIRGSFGALVRASNFASQYQAAVSAGDIAEPESYSTTDLKTDLNATTNLPMHPVQTHITFKGNGTAAVLKSSNISSLADLGVGNYRINFATALPHNDYCCTMGGHSSYTGNWGLDIWQKNGSTRSTTQFQVHCRDDGASTRDPIRCCLMFITD